MTRRRPAAADNLLAPRYWPSWAGVGLLRLLALLPFPLIAALGAGLGTLAYPLLAARRRIVRINLALCFPGYGQAERRRLARAHFRAFATALLAAPIGWWGSPRRLHRLVRVLGREHLEVALAARQHIILLAPHFVAMDTGGMVLATLGVPHVIVYRRAVNPVVNRLYLRRARFGGELVERAQGLRPVVKALKAGRALYYLPDQDPGRRNAVFAPFFGVPTATLNALSGMARLSGAVVIPASARLLPWGRGIETRFWPPLAPFPSGDETKDATRVNAAIEQAVRLAPEQYLWSHKRFKTRPEGEADIYRTERRATG